MTGETPEQFSQRINAAAERFEGAHREVDSGPTFDPVTAAPATKAGQSLVHDWFEDQVSDESLLRDILAIEREAAR